MNPLPKSKPQLVTLFSFSFTVHYHSLSFISCFSVRHTFILHHTIYIPFPAHYHISQHIMGSNVCAISGESGFRCNFRIGNFSAGNLTRTTNGTLNNLEQLDSIKPDADVAGIGVSGRPFLFNLC